MSQKFYEMQAAARELPLPDPKPETIYLVVAWDKLFGWSVRREHSYQQYRTREKAEEAAAKLDGRWTHRTIVEIKLPASA